MQVVRILFFACHTVLASNIDITNTVAPQNRMGFRNAGTLFTKPQANIHISSSTIKGGGYMGKHGLDRGQQQHRKWAGTVIPVKALIDSRLQFDL